MSRNGNCIRMEHPTKPREKKQKPVDPVAERKARLKKIANRSKHQKGA